MKSPVVIVAITLTAAILVASLLIIVGTRKGAGTTTLNAPTLQQRVEQAHMV